MVQCQMLASKEGKGQSLEETKETKNENNREHYREARKEHVRIRGEEEITFGKYVVKKCEN